MCSKHCEIYDFFIFAYVEPKVSFMQKKGLYTYTEIMQQPRMWKLQYDRILAQRESIEAFIRSHIERGYQVIFTGAGTSAYIGDALVPAVAGSLFDRAIAVPTTDIITHPEVYFAPSRRVLLVSFARSGNSPESLGAIDLADRLGGEQVAHIFITCNAEGQLARIAGLHRDSLLLLLPEETDDKSLAMTSSFSTMLLTALMVSRIDRIVEDAVLIRNLAEQATRTLELYAGRIESIAGRDFSRAIFLGSGELKGIAEESHLKLQELTDGGVMCSFDSFLGFRHGPKAVVKGDSLLVYLVSGKQTVRRYEEDLIRQINTNNHTSAQIAVSVEPYAVEGVPFDLNVVLGTADTGVYGCVPYVFTAQLLGYYKSLNLGLNPDSPSVSGNIHRVVEGVTIYPYEE
ncbi:SIS domain-containing protein [Alistipes sp.]|uniref:SIS domain-containing protein n=1 Tax=Alistipes sp. TaxID=1872444 RepID=UPI0025C60E00|nr:SIS domain-containing protein [Alistipes sp.]